MPMNIGTQMPSLDGATEWFGGTEAHALAEAQGHPTLVHFWSINCAECKDNLTRIAEWRDARRAEGLRVIAVHTPRDEAEVDVEEVRAGIAQHNITEPCAIDNEHKLGDAFQNEHGNVPAYYLFDAKGKLMSFAAGESALDKIASALARTLSAEPAQKASTPS